MDKNKGNKRLREGVTTGSCAAAAAKAAVLLLLGNKVESVSISLPEGGERDFIIETVMADEKRAIAKVKKDAGDDPDVTDGIHVLAEATWSGQKGVSLSGGKGIGTVTKKGLKVPIGEKAINPVPRKMILSAVAEAVSDGVHIEISVPQGEEIARRTMNGALGIKGGISILGTTGIVKPMSRLAMKESILLHLNVIKENYLHPHEPLVLVFGNIGKQFAVQKIGYSAPNILITGNFLGPVLDEAVRIGISDIVLVGHIGKVVKVSAGIFDTHSKIADGRMETLCAYTALSGGDLSMCQKIYDCNTTDEAVQYLKINQLERVFEMVVHNAKKRMEIRCLNQAVCHCILFSQEEKVLADSGKEEIQKGGDKK